METNHKNITEEKYEMQCFFELGDSISAVFFNKHFAKIEANSDTSVVTMVDKSRLREFISVLKKIESRMEQI